MHKNKSKLCPVFTKLLCLESLITCWTNCWLAKDD